MQSEFVEKTTATYRKLALVECAMGDNWFMAEAVNQVNSVVVVKITTVRICHDIVAVNGFKKRHFAFAIIQEKFDGTC